MTADRDVFVSYRHGGATAVWVREVLVPALSKEFTVVLDVDEFLPGQVILEKMEKSSKRARLTLAVVDDDYDDSWYTRYEAALSETLLVVHRGGKPIAGATHSIALTSADPALVVAAVDRLIKRVFVLEAPEDREFVTGFLLPELRAQNIDARDVTDVAGIQPSSDEPGFESVDRAVAWADKVIVVISGEYMKEVGKDAGRHLQRYQNAGQSDRTLPVVLERPVDENDRFQIPPQFNTPGQLDMTDRHRWLDGIEKICRALDIGEVRPSIAPPCPYPGMRPYGRDGRFPFVGRNGEIELVMDRLRLARRTAVVIGPSGSGKSSLVLAGVVPRVEQMGLDGVPKSFVDVVTPADDLDKVVDALRAKRSVTTSRLLVVDQLEQAFGTSTEFLETIARLRRDDPTLYMVMTVRADFYAQLMVSPLWDLVKLDMVTVTPLRGTDLLAAISEPARSVGATVVDSLAIRLANETEGQPGLMPFLQEALRKLWGRQPWRYLSVSHQEWASGEYGVDKAIRQQADEALTKIRSEFGQDDGDRIVRSILVRLVNFVPGGRFTRHQVDLTALVDATPDPAAFGRVVEILGHEDQRIVTLGSRTVVEGTQRRQVRTAELSHEAIIDGWPEFREWIDRHHGVEIERQNWHLRVGGESLSGRDLAAAERWLASAQDIEFVVEPKLTSYIAASRTEQDAAEQRERERLEDEAEARERREAAKRRLLIGGLAASLAVTVGMIALSILALNARRNAEDETAQRVATQLQTSASAYDGGLALQALLVRAADVIDENDRGAIEMLVTAERDPGIARRIDATERNVGFEAVAQLPDGRVVIGDGVGGLFVWAADSGQRGADESDGVRPVSTELGHGILSIAIREGSPWIAVSGGNSAAHATGFQGSEGWIDLVDTSDAALPSRRVTLDTDAPVSTALFDGDRLIVGTWDGTIAIIDVSNPQNPAIERTFQVPDSSRDAACIGDAGDRKVRTLAIDDGRRWLAAGANHCIIAIWDLATLEPDGVLEAHTGKVRAIDFVPGSAELLSTGDDATLRSWDLDGERTPTTLIGSASPVGTFADTTEAQVFLEGRVVTMCVTPDGAGVVTAGRDHVVRRWSRIDGTVASVVELDSHITTVRQVHCLTESTIGSVAGDGFVVWDLDRPNRWAESIVDVEEGAGVAVAVRPDGTGDLAVASAGVARVVSPDGAQRPLASSQQTGDLELVEFGADGSVVAALARGISGWPDEILLYDADSGELVDRHESNGAGRLTALAVVDEKNLVAGMNAGELLLVRDGEAQTVSIPNGRIVTAVGMSSDGTVVAGDEGGDLFCGRPSLDAIEFSSVELGRRVNDIAVAPDGTVAAVTADGLIPAYSDVLDTGGAEACDPRTWTAAAPPVVHDSIDSVDLIDTGDVLVATTSSGTVEIWDVEHLRLIGVLTLSADDPARSVAIDPQASVIAVGGDSAALRFRVERDGLRTRLCEIAGRNLTDDEEGAFLPADRYRDMARCFDE